MNASNSVKVASIFSPLPSVSLSLPELVASPQTTGETASNVAMKSSKDCDIYI